MLRVRLFVHVHLLILVYYVFPQLVKLAHSFFDRSLVYAAPTLWNARDLDIRLLPFDIFFKKCQDTSLSEVLCKLILIVFILFV